MITFKEIKKRLNTCFGKFGEFFSQDEFSHEERKEIRRDMSNYVRDNQDWKTYAHILYVRCRELEQERDQRFTLMEVTTWLSEYHGKKREVTLRDWALRMREEEK